MQSHSIDTALRATGNPWPPRPWENVYTKFHEHAAWYSGRDNFLQDAYSGNSHRFWGRNPVISVHVPIAADIAQISSNLLFGESPSFTIPDADESNPPPEAAAAQDRLDVILDNTDINSLLAEAAETAAAMGGVYLVAAWDQEVADTPLVRVVQADAAIPVFRWGRLQQVTFWREVERSAARVVRHLETHSRGFIEHTLWYGSLTDLGQSVSLEAHDDTADLEPVIALPPQLSDVMLPIYIPNLRPNRDFRGWPQISNLGQSDYAGLEGMMDTLDATFSSWLKDVILGQARLVVPMRFTERIRDKDTFKVDRELYSELDIDPDTAQGDTITQVQFAIRSDDHLRTANAMIERIITAAGYSPQTLGLNIEGLAQSGTALRVRERRSMMTAGKKQTYWKRPLEQLAHVLLRIDQAVFNPSTPIDLEPSVSFGDSIVNDPKELAETVDILHRAAAISTREKVRRANPDWGTAEVEAEVERLEGEQGMAPDAMQLGEFE